MVLILIYRLMSEMLTMTRAAMATSAAPPTIGQIMLVGFLFCFARD